MSDLSIAEYFPFARVKVVDQVVHAQGALIRMEPDGRCHPLCHDCRSPAGTIHSKGYRRMVRDLNMADRYVWLQVEYRKVWCDRCGRARVEQLSFCNAGQRLTHRLRQYIYGLCKIMTVEDVARHLDLDPKTVKAVDKEFLAEEFGPTDYSGLHILAVDEISLSHGHRGYMTVVLDYLTGRVVWMGRDRTAGTLNAFFAGMTEQQKTGIEAVAMDMWEPYIKSVQTHCPAARIVFDLFHLVKGYGLVIDAVRRQEFKRAEDSQRPFIKGSRYLLLSNQDNLRPEQQARLADLLAANHRINAVYILKDQFKQIYSHRDGVSTKMALDRWCDLAQHITHPAMRQFVRRVRFFEYGILNHCYYPIGTSRLEGVNNKIKVIKRKAYGFHDPDYFTLKIKQALPGIPDGP